MEVLRNFDKANKVGRNRIISQLIKDFDDVSNFEVFFGADNFMLFFNRITVFLRLNYLDQTISLVPALTIMKIFINRQKPLQNFLEIGGVPLILELLQRKPREKYSCIFATSKSAIRNKSTPKISISSKYSKTRVSGPKKKNENKQKVKILPKRMIPKKNQQLMKENYVVLEIIYYVISLGVIYKELFCLDSGFEELMKFTKTFVSSNEEYSRFYVLMKNIFFSLKGVKKEAIDIDTLFHTLLTDSSEFETKFMMMDCLMHFQTLNIPLEVLEKIIVQFSKHIELNEKVPFFLDFVLDLRNTQFIYYVSVKSSFSIPQEKFEFFEGVCLLFEQIFDRAVKQQIRRSEKKVQNPNISEAPSEEMEISVLKCKFQVPLFLLCRVSRNPNEEVRYMIGPLRGVVFVLRYFLKYDDIENIKKLIGILKKLLGNELFAEVVNVEEDLYSRLETKVLLRIQDRIDEYFCKNGKYKFVIEDLL